LPSVWEKAENRRRKRRETSELVLVILGRWGIVVIGKRVVGGGMRDNLFESVK